jgi:glycosyltransferase involved in cell wall biosynthesis
MTTTNIGFMTEMLDGHVTHELNLRRHLAERRDVNAHWFPVGSDPHDLWSRVGPVGIRMGLRARAAMQAARGALQCDVIFSHTQNVVLFAPDLMLRVPTVISTDASPLGFHQFAEAYDHKIHADWIERAKTVWNGAVFRASARIIAMSEWARRGIIDDYGLEESHVQTIPQGVDTSSWTPAPERRRADGVVRFLFVGGAFRRKGGDLLLQWAGRTHLKNWEIHIVTRDDGLRLPDGVTLHRFSNNAEGLIRLAQSCDAFVLPTRGDCSPFVLAEAMAAGLPVITTRVGGVPEFVVEGKTGHVIPPNDYDALDAAMTDLIHRTEARVAMGEAARLRAVEHYDVRRNCRRIVDLLLDVAATRRLRRAV